MKPDSFEIPKSPAKSEQWETPPITLKQGISGDHVSSLKEWFKMPDGRVVAFSSPAGFEVPLGKLNHQRVYWEITFDIFGSWPVFAPPCDFEIVMHIRNDKGHIWQIGQTITTSAQLVENLTLDGNFGPLTIDEYVWLRWEWRSDVYDPSQGMDINMAIQSARIRIE